MEKMANVYVNPKDARKLGINDGEKARIWNERGACALVVAVDDSVLPGVAVSQGLWGDRAPVNALTPDRLSDMGGGVSLFSGRVAIEKVRSD